LSQKSKKKSEKNVTAEGEAILSEFKKANKSINASAEKVRKSEKMEKISNL